MQHNESNNQPNGFRRMLKEKGYYILLTLCIVAVGVSGVVFVTSAVRQSQEAQETLSIPAKATDPDQTTKPQTQQTPASSQTKPGTAQSGQSQPETKPQTGSNSSAAVAETVTVAPVSGAVIGGYAMEALAYNATTQDWRVHNGVDLAAAEGENVLAARAGTVTAVYEDEAYGTTVVIQHDDGYTTHYCNLAEGPSVSAGQTVAAGDVVGVVGRTAVLEVGAEPHLHFAVFLDGAPMDPSDFLA